MHYLSVISLSLTNKKVMFLIKFIANNYCYYFYKMLI